MLRKCRTCKNWRTYSVDVPGEGVWYSEMCSRKVIFRFLCRKYEKKSFQETKSTLYQKLEKGNGITLFGTSVMLVTFLFFYLIIQVFLISHRASSIQQAIDNVSDSVAVYMATEGEDYADAVWSTSEVVNEIKDNTGVDLEYVTVDVSDLEDNVVTAHTKPDYKGVVISRASSTYFTPGAGLREKLISYAMMWVGVTPYKNYYTCMENGEPFPNNLIEGTDCSGFIALCYHALGLGPGLSNSLYSFLSSGREISLSELQPGDVIMYGYGDKGDGSKEDGMAHVALYAGDGMVINNGGGLCSYVPIFYSSNRDSDNVTHVISILD